jgi:hypothetical protein
LAGFHLAIAPADIFRLRWAYFMSATEFDAARGFRWALAVIRIAAPLKSVGTSF